MSESDPTQLQIGLSAAQLAMVDDFQRQTGLPSREAAIVFLLDIALEAVTGTGRRFWDKPITDLEPIDRARELMERLRAEGHQAAAERVEHATLGQQIGAELLNALRAACQFALTTIEALDPKTQLMAEELRLEIDKRLSR
jgi:hypothetical protein